MTGRDLSAVATVPDLLLRPNRFAVVLCQASLTVVAVEGPGEKPGEGGGDPCGSEGEGVGGG